MSPPEGRNVKQKAGHFGLTDGRVEPHAGARHQRGHEETFAMLSKSCLAVLAVVLSVAGTPARAMVCMDKSMTLDEVADAISTQKSCASAMKLFQDCQLTASGDVQLGAAVEKKCEADFMPGLSTAQHQAYKREMRACDLKYRNKSGTMYLSFAAFCRAEVAQRHSQRALKAAGQKAR
ncbi:MULTISPECIES: hypothetical protein [Bradyrhizobium]|uniref:hypothetical protein n=1 Tax=Bradyrhizobium TaxID=374 RepID=UPI003A102F69